MILRLAILLGALLMFNACGDMLNGASESDTPPTAPALNDSDLEALNQDMKVYKDAVKLQYFPSVEGNNLDSYDESAFLYINGGTTKHGNRFHRIHLNRIAMNALLNNELPFPDGSLAIMELSRDLNSERRLVDVLYVMKKIKGYSSESNDWYFTGAQNAGAETKHKPGWEQSCIKCHSKSNTDFIQSTEAFKSNKP